MDDFRQKLNKLPHKVQEFFISDYSRVAIFDLMSKYKINDEEFNKFSKLVASLFFKDLKISDLKNQLIYLFSISGNEVDGLSADIVGFLLLPVKDFFSVGEIESYITNSGRKINDYEKRIHDKMAAIEAMDNEDEDSEIDESKKISAEPVSVEQEKSDSLEVFTNNLVTMLSDFENDYVQDYNFLLIEYFFEDEDFRKKLESILLANQEILTNNNLDIDGKQNSPTIANWLRDFIKQNGSGMFDNIVLSSFLTNSRNGSRLSSENREVLRRLLLLYRNLKFFPDSMGDTSPEFWEIIPVDKLEQPIARQPIVKEVKGSVKPTQQKPIVASMQSLDEMHRLMESYPPGSLERRAIEEEINRL